MKLLFLLPAPDKELGTVDLITISEPDDADRSDWRTTSGSFYEELGYELNRHEAQFREQEEEIVS